MNDLYRATVGSRLSRMESEAIHQVVHLVNNIELNTLSCGKDTLPTIVFLHGFPTFSAVWSRYLTAFGSDYHCIAPDLRGFNRSSKPEATEAYRITHSVADIVGLLRKVSPGQPVMMVAHDIGGYLAYVLASLHPELICGLVVINGAHPNALRRAIAINDAQAKASGYIEFLSSTDAPRLLSKAGFKGLLNICREMREGHEDFDLSEQDLLDAWSQLGAATGMLNWYRANRHALTPQTHSAASEKLQSEAMILVPHLLIWGQRDPYLLAACHQCLDSYCSDLQKVLISDAGHIPHETHANLMYEQISCFLKRCHPAAGV